MGGEKNEPQVRSTGQQVGRVRGRRRHLCSAILLLLGVALVVGGVASIGGDFASEGELQELAEDVTTTADDGDGELEVDWDALLASAPGCVGWLRVAGTAIDYPVMQSGADDPDYYLHHDVWGSYSSAGAIYLDASLDANGSELLIYGHHMRYANSMFASIAGCFDQEDFDVLGTASWVTPEEGETTFVPLCAMKADMYEELVRRTGFSSEDELRAWLRELLEASSACSEDAEELVASGTRAMVLVTCSGRYTWGSRARTVVVFVSGEGLAGE